MIRSMVCLLSFFVVFAIAGSAAAQETAPAVGAIGKSSVLEELVVTATRRSTGLQDTAVAATVLTGDAMQRKNVFDMTQIQYAAPSVSIGDYGSANTFNIRGIGRSQVDIDLPAGIQLYRDGVPMFPGYFQNEPYFDMAGMEVLRGPQGTLAGKSAAGGAIFIRTNDAELGQRDASFEGGVGNYDLWETTGMVNVPIGDTFAFRLAGNHQERDDYWKSITGNFTGNPDIRNLESLRLTLNWQPDEKWDTKLKVDWNNLDFGGTPTTPFGTDPLRARYDGNYTYRDRSIRGILDLKYHFDNGMTATSLTGYQFSDTVNNRSNTSGAGPFDNPGEIELAFLSKGNFSLFSQELNLLSPEDQRLHWVTGAFYQHIKSSIPSYPENGFNLTFLGVGAKFPFVYSPWNNTEDDISVFGNAGYDLTDTLELEAGVRYSHYERQQIMQFHVSLDGGFTLPPTFPIEPVSDEEISENSVDWKVGLNWTLHPDHFLYAFAARGHTTGGINIGGTHTKYDEVKVYDFETGWKGTLLDGRVQTQFGGYYQILKNFQGVFETPQNSLGSVAQNADDDSTIYGIEANIQTVFNNLSIDFGGAWTVTELGTFADVLIPGDYLRYFPGAVIGDTVDLTGSQSPYSPELTFNIGAAYTFHFGNGTTVTPRVDFSFIGQQKDGLYDIPILEMDQREIVNLTIRIENGPWYGLLYMNNATDFRYIGGIQNLGQLNYVGAPRMYGLKVGRSFEGW